MKKIYVFAFCLFMGNVFSQNGTQPDSARVIVSSFVVKTINVLLNDNLVGSKNYTLQSVYKSTTSPSINIAIVGSNVTFQETQTGIVSNDTFFYVVKDQVSSTFDTNYVVVRKSDLNLDLYPGDANKDKICNNIDVLNIGASMGRIGDAREGDYNVTNWVALRAYDWNSNNALSNSRFSDANGDGKIDSIGDIGIIHSNYNKTYNTPNPVYSPTGGKSFVINTPDTLKLIGTSAKFQIGVELGTATSLVSNCYGLAFTIKFDTAIFKPTKINFIPNKWFSDLHQTIDFSKINFNSGEIDVCIVRNDGGNNSGGGQVGSIDILVEDVMGLTAGLKTNFHVVKAVLVDSFLNKLPVTLAAPKDVILIKKSTSTIQNTGKKELNIYQNNDKLIIDVNKGKVDKLSVYNILGKEIYFSNTLYSNSKIEIEVSDWSPGIYIIQLDTVTKKITIK